LGFSRSLKDGEKVDNVENNVKSEDILKKICSQIKTESFLRSDEKPCILNYLNFLIISITNKAKEISVDLDHDYIKEEDLRSAIKKVIPPWEPDIPLEEIERLIENGKDCLIKKQRCSGWGTYSNWMHVAKLPAGITKWTEEPPLKIWDTAMAIHALLNVGESKDSKIIRDGVEWLKIQLRNDDKGYPYLPKEYWKYLPQEYCPIGSSVYETSYAMISLLEAGEKVNSPFIQESVKFLLTIQNKDYRAWGPTPYENMSVGATSCAVRALVKAEIDPKSECIQSAIRWLEENQREDGGWSDTWKGGSSDSLITKTYDAISALLASGLDIENDVIKKGVQYLLLIQDFIRNENGEWGWVWTPNVKIDISNIENTATAVATLLRAGIKADNLHIKMGIRWLLKNRDFEGSWGNDTPRVIICLNEYLKYSRIS
jgi:Squalene cyclase